MASVPGGPSRRDDVLAVKGVGEKRTPAQWAILIGVPGVLVVLGAVVVLALTHSKPQVSVDSRAAQPGQVAGQGTNPATPVQPDATAAIPQSPTDGTQPTTVASNPTEPAGAGTPAAAPSGGGTAVWDGFRGPGRMGISNESLARAFPAGGPKRLWQLALGEGHAGAAVYKGRVYVLDYNVGAGRDELRCLDLSTGKQLWSQGYAVAIKPNHGISRTVPAVDGKYVVTIGPMCQVMCCDANSGKLIWKKDLVKEYGAIVPTWYAGQCPLIDGGNAILAPGGKALMVAVQLATGKVAWTTPNAKGWEMTHSSIMPVDFAGKRIYVYPASGGVIGVNSRDGKLLWSTPQWTVNTANVPMPVPIGDGRIFVCGGYNSGAAILQMGAGGASVSMVRRIKPTTFQSHQQTPILYQGHLYGVRMPGDLVCLDLNGNVVWSSGNTARFGIGPYTMANGVLYVLSDKGDLTIAEANPSAYRPLAKAKVLTGPDAWAPIAVADGKLICRDKNTMICLDMRP